MSATLGVRIFIRNLGIALPRPTTIVSIALLLLMIVGLALAGPIWANLDIVFRRGRRRARGRAVPAQFAAGPRDTGLPQCR